jgi:hypothetical protein
VDSDDNGVIVVIRNRLSVTRYSTHIHTHMQCSKYVSG